MLDSPSEPVPPLAGIRVLDLTRALSGPFCTMQLADLGAEVVKVESAKGDVVRLWGPFDGEESLYFRAANRNKRSIVVDMWSDEGRELLRRIAPTFDVLVENFRPGVLDALGLGSDWSAEHAPDLLVASISGFGHVGPMRAEPCFDQVVQGMSGFMSLTGTAESGPLRAGIPLADLVSGLFAALGICAALAGKRKGRRVQTSMLESMIGMLTFVGQGTVTTGKVPGPVGNDHPVVAPYGVYPTADQPINIAVGTERQWVAFCELIGAPELITDPRFERPPGRTENRDALREILERKLSARAAQEWLDLLRAVEIPCGPIYDLGQVFADPQVRALGLVVPAGSEPGAPAAVRSPIWTDSRPPVIARPAPELGADTAAVLAECGLEPAEVERLSAAGVVDVRHQPVTGTDRLAEGSNV